MITAKQKKWIIVYLLIAMPISGASVDIYVPSLPAMTSYFNTDKSLAQLTITLFLLGYSFFCLIFGPMSDAIGRKKPLIFGAALYTLSGLLIAISPSIYVLLILRFIQGIGVAAIAGVSRAITPDVFEGDKYQHVTNMTTIAWSIGPIAAPFIGGYFQHYLSWQWCFYTLALYGFIQLLLIIFVLPETLQKKSTFSSSILIHRTQTLLTSPIFIGSTIISGLVYSCIITFNTMGPFLIQIVLSHTSVFYGYIALGMGFAFFIGNYINKRLIATSCRFRLDIAISILVISTLIEAIMLLKYPINIYNIALPSFVILLSCGIFFPNSYGTALRLYPSFSGTASAILSASFIFIAAITSGIASLLKAQNQVDFTLLFMIIAILMTTCYLSLFRPAITK